MPDGDGTMLDHAVILYGSNMSNSDLHGLILVDGGLEQHSRELVKAALKAASARRVQTLFNTHWHPEQTGSNERIGKAGARIVAHANTKLWLTRKVTVGWRPGSYGPLPPKALPTDTLCGTTIWSTNTGDW
jgi:glyoxylase-like metal-dependent hydrolase (beta-lactamase superfamily II)